MFLSAPEYVSTRCFSSYSFPTSRAPDLGHSNKLLTNWKSSLKKLSLATHVLLLFQQKRSAWQRALCYILSSCPIALSPEGPLFRFNLWPSISFGWHYSTLSTPPAVCLLVFGGLVTSFFSLPPDDPGSECTRFFQRHPACLQATFSTVLSLVLAKVRYQVVSMPPC